MSTPPRRFFVEVQSRDRAALRRLQGAGLDLFRTTARQAETDTYVIDGLLTLDQVGELVGSGHQVLVKAPADAVARSRSEVAEFSEWRASHER